MCLNNKQNESLQSCSVIPASIRKQALNPHPINQPSTNDTPSPTLYTHLSFSPFLSSQNSIVRYHLEFCTHIATLSYISVDLATLLYTTLLPAHLFHNPAARSLPRLSQREHTADESHIPITAIPTSTCPLTATTTTLQLARYRVV